MTHDDDFQMNATASARGLRLRWLRWLVGAAIVAAVIVAALKLSEEQEIWRLLRTAEPVWILVALLAQLGTYLTQGEIWRIVTRAAGQPLALGVAAKLSLAKLFVDQALPSSGISGTALFARALEQRGTPRPVLMAAVSVNLVSYFAAYVICLIAALAALLLEGHANALILVSGILFGAASMLVISALLALSGRVGRTFANRAAHWPLLGPTMRLLTEADRRLSHEPRLLGLAIALQLAIVLLDALTVWMLLAAVGSWAAPGAVFASFVISSMLRSISIVPGGLGIFEAASVLTLKIAGVPLPAALSATLMFRGLSFWLPMLPGMVLSRRVAANGRVVAPQAVPETYWARTADVIAAGLATARRGLSQREAARRLESIGPNEFREHRKATQGWLLWKQIRSPLLLLLAFAAVVSAATGAWLDASIVFAILAASVIVGYSREQRAESALARLRSRIATRTVVLRDGEPRQIPVREVVPGDVVQLSAGALVPADALLFEAADLFVNEALLTGESFPVEKTTKASEPEAGVAARRNCVFQGTNVRSGSARCLVVATGASTEFGAIAHRLVLRPPETEFERGVRRFGYLLTSTMLAIVLVVFAINLMLGRPLSETLLFSIALAVGLSPELLPAILSVNLARGAQLLADHGVLVRSLNAIENLGSIDILCTDKTGTLTEGIVRLDGAWDDDGLASPEIARLAACNAALQTGLANPLDEAILRAGPAPAGVSKIAEIPYDFVRKRLSVVMRDDGVIRLVTKGAFESVLATCTRLRSGQPLDDIARGKLLARYEEWGRSGIRTLAVAARDIDLRASYGRSDEAALTFMGFLTFLDRPRDGTREAIVTLQGLGVSIKLITGDNRLVAAQVAGAVGLPADRVITGRQLDELHDHALLRAAENITLFAEVDPNQKERIIQALRRSGHVVGFLGDGVNDAPAMHAADVSLSVDTAVDVAREAADFVLLDRDLEVIRRGIEEGRRTFANTLKYILMTTSANLGNMISMALASLVLPFLPLLASQILLNNFLSDLPAFGLATDTVDRELVDRPRRWSIPFIGRFMIEFGLLSSLFDFATFGVLLLVFMADASLFRTGWFLESLLSELVIAIIVRTRRRFYRSRPGQLLLTSTLGVAALAIVLPYTPIAPLLGFEPLPPGVLAAIVGITALYAIVTEFAKGRFFRSAEPARL